MRTKHLILRWSVLTGGLIALFWLIYYLVTGHVPATPTTIKVTEGLVIDLSPGHPNRLWDILIGPIWSTLIILLSKAKSFDPDKGNAAAWIYLGLVYGVLVALLPITSSVTGVGPSILGTGIVAGLLFGTSFAHFLGFGFGLTFGLIYGIVPGIIALICAGIIAGGLAFFIKLFSNTRFWICCWNFMLDKQ